ncbi:MAG TPA: RnfH family protein [Burkholderiales bacterium]|nr:RnfH family protein [Burkholderiales bacterium]
MAEISVQLVYPLADRQTLIDIRLPAGSTVADAISRSGILQLEPKIDLSRHSLAIWGRLVADGHMLRDRDRIEILRPLCIDPKTARRQRAGSRRPRN